jgi:ABC-type uncharacterized transport system permease subunit
VAEEHASILDENDQIVSKCKYDAMRNSEKIKKEPSITMQSTTSTIPSTKQYVKLIYENKLYISIIFLIIIVIMLGIIIYKWFTTI